MTKKLVSPRSRAGEEDSTSFVFTVPDDEPIQKHAYHGPAQSATLGETETMPVRGQHSTENAKISVTENKPPQEQSHPARLPSYPHQDL